MKHTIWKRTVHILLSAIFCAISCAAAFPYESSQVMAAYEVPLSLKQAQTLALSNSKAYKKITTKINLQNVKYAEAIKSIALKQKNMKTFRWTPLLSFKFPEQPDLADSYEWQYKPIQIQYGLTSLYHELADLKYEITEKVSNLYVQAYISQEKISFARQKKSAMEETYKRNRILLKTGEASQADVDKMEQSLKKLDSDISLKQRELETAKSKMTEIIRLDVTYGYRFENPMLTVNIERSALSSLTDYTLENDHGYYEAKMNSRLGLISLELNEKLMNGHYGSKMNSIRPFVNQAKKGAEIDEDAFKAAYDNFLYTIEKPWNGSIRILFIKIPKEWFKGSLDGVRYIEDDPYVLYTNALEYTDLKNEEESVRSALVTNVTDSFEAIVTAQNAYSSLEKEMLRQEKAVEKALLSNQLGELTYEELRAEQDSYESLQTDTMDALASLSELLYSFDRLTCGGVSKYLSGELTKADASYGGSSFLTEESAEGAAYYIRSKVEDNLFLFGIIIPDDYSLNVTDFELWVNGTQIGERTAATSELKHLTLALEGIDKATVRLYDGDTFLAECEIDPMVSSGALEVTGGYRVTQTKKERAVAAFSCTMDEELGTAILRFQKKTGESIAFYQIQDSSGKAVYQNVQIPLEEPFRYLALAGQDLESLRVVFYNADGEKLYQARLDETAMEAVVETDEKG